MLGNRIRERRLGVGLSQTKVAAMIGVAESTLSDFELGKRKPWPKVRQKLALVLGCTESELFPER